MHEARSSIIANPEIVFRPVAMTLSRCIHFCKRGTETVISNQRCHNQSQRKCSVIGRVQRILNKDEKQALSSKNNS